MSDLDHGSKPNISHDELSQRRRALIKGSAIAIPAILTLRSGSALAVTSASCLVGPGQANPPGVVKVIPPGDDWLRQSTDCRDLTVDTNTVHVFKDPTTSMDHWYEYDPDNNTGINSGTFYQTEAGSTNASGKMLKGASGPYPYKGTPNCYVLVHLNADGTKSGVVGAPTESPYLATESCYESIS